MNDHKQEMFEFLFYGSMALSIFAICGLVAGLIKNIF